jgi:hypothetical protein
LGADGWIFRRGERAKVTAHELIHNPAVEAAVLEVAKSMLGTVGPLLAARQLIKIASDSKHKHQMRAVEAIANRTGLPEVDQIEIKHTNLTGEALMNRLRDVAGRLGLDPEAVLSGEIRAQLPPPVALEAVEVEVDEVPQETPEWCGLGKNAV